MRVSTFRTKEHPAHFGQREAWRQHFLRDFVGNPPRYTLSYPTMSGIFILQMLVALSVFNLVYHATQPKNVLPSRV